VSSYAYNPFTSNLDLVGSGASYIDGVVATPASLPVTLNTPALDAVYLAKAGSGVWLISRRPAGLYCRVANNGNVNDWQHLGAFPEVNSSANWELYDGSDPTKELKFDLSGISTGTTRTLTAPNASGTIALTSGTTFTTLAATNGTITASAPVLDLSQTWNNGAVTFTGLAATITNTASATGSLVARLTVGSTNVFEVDGRGFTTLRKVATSADFVDIFTVRRGTTKVFGVRDDGATQATGFSCGAGGDGASNMNSSGFGVRSSGSYSISSDSAAFNPDVFLRRDAAGVFAQYNAANPQAYRLYSTFTSTTNFERLNIAAQTGGSFIIGTEKGSAGGTARALEFQTDGVTRLTIGTDGTWSGPASANLVIAARGTGALTFDGNEMYLARQMNGQGNNLYNFATIGFGNASSVGDAVFTRDAANTIAQRRGTNAQTFRVYNTVSGTSNVNFERTNFRWASNEFIIDAEFGGTGTSLRGIKIGSATSSLLGFYGVTPVDQPATVADPAGGGTVDTEARAAINAIIDRLQELGLIA